MATNNKKINVAELDFDKIKENIKEFYRGQELFQDYDFEGSALSILIDNLAYNTHYGALYTNLAVNESFLDSASKRDSAVSIAKGLGYTPRSARSSSALVDLFVNSPTSNPAVLVLPAKTPFSATIDGVTYTFTTKYEAFTNLANNYTFRNVEIVEGENITQRYNVESANTRYVLGNTNIDTSTMRVRIETQTGYRVYNDAAQESVVEYFSEVYYLKELDGGIFEIYFGQDVVGKQPEPGTVVVVDYVVSSGAATNGARSFTYNGPDLIGGVATVSTVSAAAGGAEPETIESIKVNATKYRAAHNRAVTADDYRALVLSSVPEAESVSVYGGEDLDPPVYGKVIICIKPVTTEYLTPTRKSEIVSGVLKKKGMISITPEIIDPEYIYVDVTAVANYDPNETSRNSNEIASLMIDAIVQYDQDKLGAFGSILRGSNLLRYIDNSEQSVINSNISLKMRKAVEVRLDTTATYSVKLVTPIFNDGTPGIGVTSSGFYLFGDTTVYYLDDDGAGKIRQVYIDSNNTKIVKNNQIGTVDYATGTIQFSAKINAIQGIKMEVLVKPATNDIVSSVNGIVTVDANTISAVAVPDYSTSGNTTGYTFSNQVS